MDVARRFVAPDSWRWLVHREKGGGGVERGGGKLLHLIPPAPEQAGEKF